MSQLAKVPTTDGLERVLIEGDLGGLSQPQRIAYYQRVCESVGLNPLTQPFEYLKLNGKTVLYAKRACTDQLRKIHAVSVSISARERVDGIYVVTARATTPDGRCDESIGAVPVEGLKGEALSNALMKAETKAKRRVTLAICGLSMLDETEVASVQSTAKPTPIRRTLDDVAQPPAPVEVAHDPQTGEVQGETLDEYGLAIPPYSCPVFQSGPDAGKTYADVPAGKLRALLANKRFAESATAPQRAWAEYLVERHEREKAETQLADDLNAEGGQ